MCITDYCLTPWLPVSPIVQISITIISGLIVWKLVKAVIDSIPVVG